MQTWLKAMWMEHSAAFVMSSTIKMVFQLLINYIEWMALINNKIN